MVEIAGTMIAIGEAMIAEDVEGVVVESILTIRTKVCFVVPTLSPTCHEIAGSLTSTVPTVNVGLFVCFIDILHCSHIVWHGCIHILCQQGSSEVVGTAAGKGQGGTRRE